MLRILVIEDSPINMVLMAAILEHAGHTMLKAETAGIGLEIARQHQPDLVLMDLQLPDIDGLAATRLLKADPKTAALPVIALTAFAMKSDEADTQAAGCDGHVTKPIRDEQLWSEISRVLPGHVRQLADPAAELEAMPVRPTQENTAADDSMGPTVTCSCSPAPLLLRVVPSIWIMP